MSDFGRAVSRILSSLFASGENHLSQQPVPGTRPALRNMERAAPWSPIWPCTRWGFPCLRAYAWSGGLLPHLFTLTLLRSFEQRKAVYSLWHFPSARLAAWPPACIFDLIEVTRHRALWSSDFPPPACAGSDPPPFQNHDEYTHSGWNRNRPFAINYPLFRHRQIHIPRIIQNPPAIAARHQLLLRPARHQ